MGLVTAFKAEGAWECGDAASIEAALLMMLNCFIERQQAKG
jgi:hypothetical protein